MSLSASVSLLVTSLLLACATPPRPVPAAAPALPRVEVRVYRELPDGSMALWGTLPLAPLPPGE